MNYYYANDFGTHYNLRRKDENGTSHICFIEMADEATVRQIIRSLNCINGFVIPEDKKEIIDLVDVDIYE